MEKNDPCLESPSDRARTRLCGLTIIIGFYDSINVECEVVVRSQPLIVSYGSTDPRSSEPVFQDNCSIYALIHSYHINYRPAKTDTFNGKGMIHFKMINSRNKAWTRDCQRRGSQRRCPLDCSAIHNSFATAARLRAAIINKIVESSRRRSSAPTRSASVERASLVLRLHRTCRGGLMIR